MLEPLLLPLRQSKLCIGGKKFTNCVLKLTIVLEAALIRDGNGYIPVGYWPPIPVPARTKFYPSGYPYPKNIPENYI